MSSVFAKPDQQVHRPAGVEEGRDIAVGRTAIEEEAAGLQALAASLDASFGEAVERLHAITGRVIVTGMGKSGHIAGKIAATLASTGTPAYFVHPAEASHGDLGMILPGDAVLALSNSGNTPELAEILAYTRRFGILLVALTSRQGSALAEAADIVLRLPAVKEACPMGLAPTTSTTMALALGDALAVALLERRGFSAADFKVFHPRGSLGKQLAKAEEVMHRFAALPLCRPDTRMGDAILLMTTKSFGCVGVVDDAGALIGIITDGDLRRNMRPDLLSLTAASLMTRDPVTIRRTTLAAEALRVMNERKVTSLFVVEEGRPVGFIHMHDLLREGVA